MVGGFAQVDIAPEAFEWVTLPLGEWLPDAPEHNNPGAVEALNVIPAEAGSYRPFKKIVSVDIAVLSEQALGGRGVILDSDVTQIYAGGASGIYTRLGGPFSSIYSVPVAMTPWQFVRVNEQMVALHPDQAPLKQEIGTLNAAVAVGGTPPTASCGAQIGDFLMLGNLRVDPDDFGGAFPNRVRWGGFNNIDLPWVTDPATQADFQDLPAEGGPVVAIAGREYGTIFQARMISRASYRGPPAIFDIVQVEDKRGAISRDCIVDIGQYNFFIAEDGFFIWNGTNATPIGDGKVTRYFFNRLEYSERSKIVGAVDFVNGCVLWAFPTDTSGLLKEIIIYSYRENKWSHSIQTLEALFNSATSNVTVEDLTLPLEEYTVSFDSAEFLSGGRTQIAGFNADHIYGMFTGGNMQATTDTGLFSGPIGRRAFVSNSRPNVDLVVPAAEIQVAQRNQLIGQSEIFSAVAEQEIDGTCPIIADSRYMRFRLVTPEDVEWTHATGVDIFRKAGGVF